MKKPSSSFLRLAISCKQPSKDSQQPTKEKKKKNEKKNKKKKNQDTGILTPTRWQKG
jgi:hypothetical protein